MPPPDDVSLGELNRNLKNLTDQVAKLDVKLETKMMSVDVYAMSHEALVARVAKLEKTLDSMIWRVLAPILVSGIIAGLFGTGTLKFG